MSADTIPPSGTVWFSKIRTVFGGVNPVRIRDYYFDATAGYTSGIAGIPARGAVFSIRDLRGKAKVQARRYPPVALTGGSTTVSGQAYANGAYTVTSSSSQHTSGPYMAFDRNNDPNNWNCMWHTSDNSFVDATGVPNEGAQAVTIGGVVFTGHWLKLAMPVGVAMNKYSVTPRQDGGGPTSPPAAPRPGCWRDLQTTSHGRRSTPRTT